MSESPRRGPGPLGLVIAFLLAGALPAAGQCPDPAGQLCLPQIFQDGLVLQREVPITVWGWAAPGAPVRAVLHNEVAEVTADASGAWSAAFPALPAGGAYALTVSTGAQRKLVRDILVGDVWVASGQSNMEWPLARDAQGTEAVAAARDPLLREFAVPHTWAELPQVDLAGGSWAAADPAHAGRFSAIGYYFARSLRQTTGVPIGIIHTSWGGANIESWMSPAALGLSDSAYAAVLLEEMGRQDSIRQALELLLGQLPAQDPGLVDGLAVWADPALPDSDWTALPVPSLWEQAGFDGLDGVAWYRTAFTLTGPEAAAGVRLSLGTIDDDDITWVNGVEVGRTTGYA
jgi:sialate O-acetylesterase